jgi:hypothetical protein
MASQLLKQERAVKATGFFTRMYFFLGKNVIEKNYSSVARSILSHSSRPIGRAACLAGNGQSGPGPGLFVGKEELPRHLDIAADSST